MSHTNILPVAVIGAGPVGLAAVAHLIARGLPVKLYESGDKVGNHIRDWGHVRLFSPWKYNVDEIAKGMLEKAGWLAPEPEVMPTGAELIERYLKPLAAVPALAEAIETGVKVTAISRQHMDKVVTRGREDRPFVLSVQTKDGLRRDLARAVIDASGTWSSPNPLGADGTPAEGEKTFKDRIVYGIPDVLGRDRETYVGKTVLVVGAGHSAANVLLDLDRLSQKTPGTKMLWATRSRNLTRVYGGGKADKLAARGELGDRLRSEVESGSIALTPGFAVEAILGQDGRLLVRGDTDKGTVTLGPIDRIVVTTGQRPDLAFTRELRLDLDPWLESSKALGPLIDPNLHSCGSVPPHGHRELAHPETGFYTVGIKSYGRAPTFLLLTGYEQVRSVVAAIAGDLVSADDVRLILPETGVCSTKPIVVGEVASSGCCGGPAPKEVAVEACCIDDLKEKIATGNGCGCS
ncbi:NAD(P)-binding domain-containing protein [Lacibacterium aquatile]|uniref:NAD(P)-binding domain-containing protein n=1 Tax=Lacibacterium aquatile TaxID=1168082 RepID=A0ABW5DRS6_9PROT